MRLACGLAIALGLSFPVTGTALPQPQPPDAANTEQAPPATPATNQSAPLEQVPDDTSAAPAKKPPVVKPKTDAKPARPISRRRRRAAPVPPAPGTPRTVVVREGGAKEPAAQIAPGMTPAETARQRQNAEEWLGSTDDQLKQMAGRTLDAQQQEMVGQIRNYVEGARSALKEGDVRRASTLAEKAHLLADDLGKR